MTHYYQHDDRPEYREKPWKVFPEQGLAIEAFETKEEAETKVNYLNGGLGIPLAFVEEVIADWRVSMEEKA